MQCIGAAFNNAQAAAKIANCGVVSADAFGARQQASRDGLDGCEGVGKFVTENADQALPRNLFFFLQGLADIRKQQEGMRCPVLAEKRLAQKPARRLCSEGVNGLVGRSEKIVECELSRAVAEATRQRAAKKLRSSIVHQLERVFAIEGKEWGVHDFEDAGKQGCGFERAHALLLQQVCESVDLP